MNTHIFLICAISTRGKPRSSPQVVDSQRLLLTAENPEEVAKKLESEVRFAVFFWVSFEHPWENDGNYGNIWDFPWTVVYFYMIWDFFCIVFGEWKTSNQQLTPYNSGNEAAKMGEDLDQIA